MKVIHLIGFLFLGVLLGALFAGDIPKILVLNSNATVEKYRIAQEAFKQSISLPVREIHLEESQWKIPKVEELLYDEYPDLIYCIGTKAYLIASKYVSERNIVFSSIVNWPRWPVAKRTYGVSNELHPGMQLTLFRYIFPAVHRIGVLYSKQYNREWFQDTSTLSGDMEIEIVGKPIHKSMHVISGLKELIRGIDALWLISDPVIMPDKDVIQDIFKACDAGRVPVFTYHEAFADYGAVLIVSVDDPTIGRQAADIAREVLSDEDSQEKVQLPAGSSIILNLRQLSALGLPYNEAALSAVNQIIE
jgi:putative ABC transport system substrate-binding protein